MLTALSGLPTVLGALIGYALGGINEIMLVLSLGFASGAMLYVVFGELLRIDINVEKQAAVACGICGCFGRLFTCYVLTRIFDSITF